jgi:hypothetical protein
MGSYTSKPPDPPAPPPAPTPRHETLATVSEQIAAIDEIIGYAKETIRVFDVDLSETGWNRPERAALLSTFLRRTRHARLDVIVHNTRHIEGYCPRLVQLQQQYGTAITIYKTGNDARGAMDPMVIVDGRHFLHRFHAEQPRAALGVEQPLAAKPLTIRFDEIWATGEPGLTGTVLGL